MSELRERFKRSLAAGCLLICVAGSAQAQLADHVEMIQLPLPLQQWIWVGAPRGDSSRVFAMNSTGTIRVLDVTRDAAGRPVYTLRPTPLLSQSTGGLARSVAFGPDPSSGEVFYVAIAGGSSTTLTQYVTRSDDRNVIDPSKTRLVWQLPGLSGDHAFGSMHFGTDGMLYIGLGDNFSSFTSQSLTTSFGKMVRIDARADGFPADPDRNYSIPAGNPYPVGGSERPEIWALGVRNPWRWSFDRWSSAGPGGQGDMWIFDVNQGRAGEINIVPGNGGPLVNYGWPFFEGLQLGSGTPQGFRQTAPVLDINRENGQCSTSGGVRYRGSEIRPWRGRVFYSDYCEGGLRTARLSSGALVDVQSLAPQLNIVGQSQAAFVRNVAMVAEDGVGELYLVSYGGNSVFRLVPSATQPKLADVARPGGIEQPDGELTAEDLTTFVGWFLAGRPEADFGGPGMSRIVDQQLTADDVIVFVNAFIEGR